jgi:NADH-quinone oxidoreductase subunit I
MFKVLKTIFWAIPRGLSVTLKYLLSKPTTVRYPEEKLTLSPRYRGLHYLERHEDGSEKCVCCGLCAAACPSGCIYMEPAENEFGERYAKVYEINELRCIFCGYCQEACPKEAIFLGKEYEFSNDRREKLIYSKDDLLVAYPKEASTNRAVKE